MSNKLEEAVGGEENSITAAHEAGHALVGWLSPAIEAVEGTAWVVGDGKSRVTVRQKIRKPATAYTIWEMGSMLAAGIAAELITHGRFRTGPCRSDLKGMLMAATELCKAAPSRTPVAPWPEPPAAKTPPFAAYFSDGAEPGHSEVMRLFYLRARQRILSHRAPYARLRILLIEKMERTGAEIAAALRVPKG